MEKIRAGKLSTRVKIQRRDEIGIIAEEINLMAGGLEESYRQVEEKQKLLTAITDGVEEEIMLIDNTFKILWANKQALETTGFSEEQIIGNYCYKISHHLDEPCKAPLHRCPIQEMMKHKKAVNVVHTHQDKDGNPEYFEISVYPLRLNENIQDDLYIHISRNVTERMKMMDELQKAKEAVEQYSHNLEDLVDKRTTQLKKTEAQLIQTGKMAAVGQLATGVSHEINNPLGIISNNTLIAKILLKKPEQLNIEELKETLKNIEDAVATSKKITKALLDFSHLSTDKLESIAINELFKKILILMEHNLKIDSITVEKEFQEDLPLIKGDAQLIQQVFFNLLINSRWAINRKKEKTGGIITIKTGRKTNEDFISVVISDTGIGIAEENIHRIFEAFYTTKDVGSGTGLGLYLTYNIIKSHKGNIEAQSRLNEGTAFKITLPINLGNLENPF
ncbi:MAG: ATP-binding protein [Candidatus Omnitrophota bacterium]